MRLGQLSRKIGVQPSRISTFLEANNYTLEAGSNSKLTEEQEQLIKSHFDYIEIEEEDAPATDTLHADAPEADTIDSNSPAADDMHKEEAVPATDTSTEEIVENAAPVLVEEEIESLEEPVVPEAKKEVNTTDEVIRAPKLKLEGLKVVGKIDLPEPKVKEEAAPAPDSPETQDSESTIEEVKEKPVRKKINQRASRNRRPERRVLTLAEKREREERTKKRLDQERKEEQKQFKAAYYESKMRERKPVGSKKKKKKPTTEHEQRPEENTPTPTTLVGKFLRWLNT